MNTMIENSSQNS